ncbi:DgaE family pyridoxal phosphate-dependent ammonia lyase [Paraliobacillus sp. JSM ZJ581]|uniref:DgaE family pyridoxal phosphate-dependent ammonia lyase n=1 Tax=Paraliobacillus sp. JSM ZJ581 TaxID=3342118 RepID=UPI0035A90B0B
MESDLNKKYGLKRVINTSGRMSILGVSTQTDTVMKAMKIGGQQYIEMSDLVDKAGAYVAKKLGSESAVVVNAASSGIALSISGIITEGNIRKSEKLHQVDIAKNQIILFKGHNVQYGAPIETMVYLGGGELVEVGYANEGKAEDIAEAINENTAAILYVKSHHAVQKNIISVEEAWEVASSYGIPLIVDAAAEEDLKKYPAISDLVIYSGSKAIEGPTSGIVAGKSNYIGMVKSQFNFIGRSMKVGKETVFGLLQALDEYFEKEDTSDQEKACLNVLLPLNELEGVKIEIVQDEAGRSIYRARVHIDATITGISAKAVVGYLKTGNVAIYTRDYGVSQGFFDIDPRPLQGDDIDFILTRLKSILGGN